MNNKTVSTKNTSAILLATVLVTGIIALSSPSFMTTASAQAEPYYGGMDKTYKKSSGKDVSVKNVKCNNVNVNVNGLELDVFPPFLSSLLTTDEAQAADNEGQTTIANTFGNDGERNNNGFKQNDKDFAYVCINNNDNVVVNETTPEPP